MRFLLSLELHLHFQDEWNETALPYAVQHRHGDMVNALVEQGTSLVIRSSAGNTHGHCCLTASQGYGSCIRCAGVRLLFHPAAYVLVPQTKMSWPSGNRDKMEPVMEMESGSESVLVQNREYGVFERACAIARSVSAYG